MQYSRLSKQYGMEIYLKKEQLHYTGSVKERGVLYLLTCLTQVTSEKEREGERELSLPALLLKVRSQCDRADTHMYSTHY